jgi:hypothetical protein
LYPEYFVMVDEEGEKALQKGDGNDEGVNGGE